jgi:hypothetical protein
MERLKIVSEYQCYEFQAIDKPLTEKQKKELRSISSRAKITSRRFRNEYNWGDLRANPVSMLAKYFDAYLYVANWGSHHIAFRIPRELVDLKTFKAYKTVGYAYQDLVSISVKGKFVLVSFCSDTEDFDDWEEAEGLLNSMIAIRNGLMHEDLRALYIGWLAEISNYDENDKTPEPPIPPGMQSLTAPLQNLADFLRVDPGVMKVAIAGSNKQKIATPSSSEKGKWIKSLPVSEKNKILIRLLSDGEEGPRIHHDLEQRFLSHWRKTTSKPKMAATKPRTASDLLRGRKK